MQYFKLGTHIWNFPDEVSVMAAHFLNPLPWKTMTIKRKVYSKAAVYTARVGTQNLLLALW